MYRFYNISVWNKVGCILVTRILILLILSFTFNLRFQWGQYAHPIFSKEGDYPHELKRKVYAKSAEQGFKRSRLPKLSKSEIEFIKGSSDFFGLNAYTTTLVYRNASLEGMYAVPSYLDDLGAGFTTDDSWPQGASVWLKV